MQDGRQGIKIDVAAIPAGIYFVHVRDTEHSISVTKVVVE